MKKFNVDELIWFIILVLSSFSIIFLIESGNITNFVGKDMIIYFYISTVVLAVFAIFQFQRIFTIKRRSEVTNKFIPLTFTLFIGVVLLYVFPMMKTYSDINNDIIFHYKEDAIIISNNNYEILENINDNREEYQGKTIVFLGYVDGYDKGEEFIVLSREAIDCCQADKEKIQVRVKGIDSKVSRGQWINIYGEINYDNNFYVLTSDYKLQNEPKELYFHH